jgi:hypothetical protein
MPIPDAQTVAQRWATNGSAASQRWLDGANATTVDPTALAIAAGPKYLQNVQTAYQQGRYQRGLQRSGKAGWLAGVNGKGSGNYSNGITSSEAKYAQAIAPVLAFEASLQTRVKAMPNNTPQDAVNRAVAWIQGMQQYKAQG